MPKKKNKNNNNNMMKRMLVIMEKGSNTWHMAENKMNSFLLSTPTIFVNFVMAVAVSTPV